MRLLFSLMFFTSALVLLLLLLTWINNWYKDPYRHLSRKQRQEIKKREFDLKLRKQSSDLKDDLFPKVRRDDGDQP